jgi:hypothetical protein
MSAFNIEEYLNSLPEDIEIIDISNKNLTYIPSLKQFNNLVDLHCYNNKLTKLPELNNSLKALYCAKNQLTQLPELNDKLQVLNCEFNLLTQLPKLNSSLQYLHAYNNPLSQLPQLNNSLEILFCNSDHLPFDINCATSNEGFLTDNKRNKINCKIRCLERFKELYYSLKFKRQFRDLLWIKVRLPKIQNQFHPDNLVELLCTVTDEELNETLDNW